MWSFIKGIEFEDEIEYVYKNILSNEDIKIERIEKRCKIYDKNKTLREFDIYYEFKVAGHTHKVAIECKNHKRPISIEIVDQFVGKLKDFNNINGCIISKNGYQKGAAEKAIANGIELVEYGELPKFNQILANKLAKVCLPSKETIGKPFYVLMEKQGEFSTTGTYYVYDKNRIPLFICKNAALSYLNKIEDKEKWDVFGVSKEQLGFICSLYKFESKVRLGVVPLLGLEGEGGFFSIEYSCEDIRKAFLLN